MYTLSIKKNPWNVQTWKKSDIKGLFFEHLPVSKSHALAEIWLSGYEESCVGRALIFQGSCPCTEPQLVQMR